MEKMTRSNFLPSNMAVGGRMNHHFIIFRTHYQSPKIFDFKKGFRLIVFFTQIL